MTELLPRLRPMLARLEADLAERARDEGVAEALAAEHAREVAARRTADPIEVWTSFRVKQIAAAWVLSLLFVRTLEDRNLVPHRLKQSDDHREQLRALAPYLGDRDYLLLVFRELQHCRGVRDVFDTEHNPVWTLAPSAEVAAELLSFAKSERGLGGFDLSGDTRFLGDVYEQLDEGVRKRFALLQTPDFVEAFILDRTVGPALRERGVDGLTVIDPTCGSGHFLLGAFRRLRDAWEVADPGAGPETWAYRAIHQVHGVDVNPYAVAIARFRLVLAYADAAGVRDLAEAGDLRLNVAVADSLLPVEGAAQQELAAVEQRPGERARWRANPFAFAQGPEAQRVLGGRRFDVVVGNPPYITVKDEALNELYRKEYPKTAYRSYQLVVPFVERFFRLANDAGWVGAIIGNGFMKREFGRKLIEEFLPTVDLTQIVDTSGAYIPGYGTPTVILFGRRREPTSDTVVAVMGKRGEPSTPKSPADGLVWSAIRDHDREVGYDTSDFISVGAVLRKELGKHPWVLKGGGADELRARIERASGTTLDKCSELIGCGAITREDSVFEHPFGSPLVRHTPEQFVREFVAGDGVRDWRVNAQTACIFPYLPTTLKTAPPSALEAFWRLAWLYREQLWNRQGKGFKTKRDSGGQFYEFSMFYPERDRAPFRISFAFVATHNHFVLDRGGRVFIRSAPIIKLPPTATEDDHLALLGYLNSSTACFWMKQVFHSKSSASQRHHPDPSRYAYEFAATGLQPLPVPSAPRLERMAGVAGRVDQLGRERSTVLSFEAFSDQVAEAAGPSALMDHIRYRWARADRLREHMVLLQEELDWMAYAAFGLAEESMLLPSYLLDRPLARGHRPFELLHGRVSAVRRDYDLVATSEAEVSSDTVLSPELVPFMERRKSAIQDSKWLQLIETTVYKRLWRDTERNVPEPEYRAATDRDHLRRWLLDRIDAEVSSDKVTRTVRQLARALHRDPKVQAVAEVYTGHPDPDLERVFDGLVQSDAVPYLAALRYKPAGLVKYCAWEKTWDAQRAEDTWEAAAPDRRGDRPTVQLPPKYGSGDFVRPEYWSLRGKLDVPKERFVSYPGTTDEDDPTLRVGWAGWDHADRIAALGALVEATPDPARRVPLLAGMQELLPWVVQWHGSDTRYGTPLGELWTGHLQGLLTSAGLTEDDLRAWRPPQVRREAARRTITRDELLTAFRELQDDDEEADGVTKAALAAHLGVSEAVLGKVAEALLEDGTWQVARKRPLTYATGGFDEG